MQNSAPGGCLHIADLTDSVYLCADLILLFMEKNLYISPELLILEYDAEGMLCGSNEIIDENQGIW